MKTKQSGFSLIEILMALAILSIVLVSIAELEFSAIQNSRQAFYQSIAVEQLSAMASVIHHHPNSFMGYISNWNQDNQKVLPESVGAIYPQNNASRIIVSWKSNFSNRWYCADALKRNYSCFELQVAE